MASSTLSLLNLGFLEAVESRWGKTDVRMVNVEMILEEWAVGEG